MTYFSSGSPLGRPRWEIKSGRAPSLRRYLIVGSARRMRVSSVTSPSLTGTLKSTRTSTRLSLKSRSLTLRLFIGLPLVDLRLQVSGFRLQVLASVGLAKPFPPDYRCLDRLFTEGSGRAANANPGRAMNGLT